MGLGDLALCKPKERAWTSATLSSAARDQYLRLLYLFSPTLSHLRCPKRTGTCERVE